MRPFQATEQDEQISLFQWRDIQAVRSPELALLFAIPNGGLRNPVVARKLKAEGVKAGVSDVMLPIARKDYHGLFIEMKRRDGGKESREQRDFREAVIAQGYKAVVCKGWEEARKVLEDYLNGDK